MRKNLAFFLSLVAFFYLFINSAKAQTANCNPLFGGGQVCDKHPDLSIDKQVQDPQTKKYTDSLNTVSNFIDSNQSLVFRITIKNTSNKALSKIELTDTLPSSLIYKSGDGKFDSKTHKLTDTIDKLDKGQSKSYTINTSVNRDQLLKSSACSINQASISQANKKGSDYVKICINISQSSQNSLPARKDVAGQTTKGGMTTTKGGLPVFSNKKAPVKTPDTGPEMVGIIGLPVLAGVGYFLRKKS